MKKNLIKILFLLIIALQSNYADAQKYEIVGKVFKIDDMTKLIEMDIDDATSYLTDFSFNLKETNNNQSYLYYELEKYAGIKFYYIENKVYSVYYVVANRYLRNFLNNEIKRLKLRKTGIESSEKGITTFYEGKTFKYEKIENVNEFGNQQINLYFRKK